MKNLLSIIFLFLLFLVLASGSTFAQGKYGTIGKKFGKKEANALFGKVINSQKVTRAELKDALAKAKDYVMFRMNKSDNTSLRENSTQNVYTESSSLTAGEKGYVFSKSVVEDFLSASTAEEFTIETRASVLTLSDGSNLLEMSAICPPMCW